MKTEDDKPGDGLRRRIERQAHQLAGKIKSWLPKGAGFVLIVFDQPDKPQARDEAGWLTYVSSVTRDGGAAIVEGLFARWRHVQRPALTTDDLNDLARMMVIEASADGDLVAKGEPITAEVMRRLAAAAAKLGASADLARAAYADRAGRPS